MAYNLPLVTNQVLASQTITAATTNVPDRDNSRHKGVTAVIVVSAKSGTTPTLDCKIQGKDYFGNYYDIPSASFVQDSNATGTYVLTLYPGLTNATSSNLKNQDGVLPKTYRYVLTTGGTTPSFTLTMSETLIP